MFNCSDYILPNIHPTQKQVDFIQALIKTKRWSQEIIGEVLFESQVNSIQELSPGQASMIIQGLRHCSNKRGYEA